MIAFALFRCCPTAIFLKQYESSTNAVLRKLGVEFSDINEFNCCGYPLKNIDFKAYVLAAARNLSLAEKNDVNILTFCNCCFNSLKQAQHLLKEDAALREDINKTLEKEGLVYKQVVEVKHLFEVLFKNIGLEKIEEKVVKTFNGLKIATHYGCHLLHPSQIIQFDNPVTPSVFDQLVEVTGATSIFWTSKLNCCGSPLLGMDDDLSMDLTQTKINNARQSGADYLCTACVYCQLQFDQVQKMMISRRNAKHQLASILYTQLLGLSLGIDEEQLGINLNELDISRIVNFLS
ncbi:MAG: CoB--CoM heterodisulfide reductase iron-sulfur subunit B family protein [Proteobacteria bacterium]|nr:CoB--CoM heterodisulfide reductase iron-sulfur subunit B family protein [Pseudomonadota bacterium]MBU4463382.1 CoB--CoM heterodisulfide reductase iron-sulfur subunit B family protein [Pseudomonadota bacterium]